MKIKVFLDEFSHRNKNNCRVQETDKTFLVLTKTKEKLKGFQNECGKKKMA